MIISTLLHYPVTAEGFVMGFLAGILSLIIVVAGRYIYKRMVEKEKAGRPSD